MRKTAILLSVFLMLGLSGCSGVQDYLEKQIENRSEIKNAPEYQTYQTYQAEGKLDEDGYGYYPEETLEADKMVADIPSDSVRISFSENSYLNIRYFSDASFQNLMDDKAVILKVGDSMYAKVSLNKNAPSSNYHFSGFRLYEVDKDGRFVQIQSLSIGEDSKVLQIPEQYAGKDLSIAPLGAYTTREVSLKDSYLDNDEKEHDLSGKWLVNEKPVTGHIAMINPVSSYIIRYEFDSNEYFYLSSEPECFYSDNDDGVVIFKKQGSTDETVAYSVKLHQYVTVKVPSTVQKSVKLNNGPEQKIKKGEDLTIPRLKYGDTVVIESDAEWKELETRRDLILQSEEQLQSGEATYKYTMIVPQKGGEFVFNPAEYQYAHGTLSFFCFGEEVNSIQYLAKGSKITYAQKTADDGYWLSEGEHVITVTTPEATRKELQSIAFTEKVRVNVQLNQPAFGGRIEYYANGARIDTSEYKSDSGAVISMKFFPWEGWINNYTNDTTYTVTASLSQSAKVNGKDVASSAFTESADHKPLLEVVLAKSVGADMKFEFEASGLTRSDYRYEEAWYRNDYTVIKKQPIGTEKGITISMGNRALQTGTAVKILVEMTGEDKSKNKAEKISVRYNRLVDSLSELQEPINIYDKASLGNSGVWYKNIKITISVVDVMKYSAPEAPAHGSVTVRSVNTAEILHDGDIFEGAEKVTVTIEADKGYFVSGKNVKNDVYQTTVRFENCLADIQKMISENPIVKYVQITLDPYDPFGTCVYKYDGKAVFGTINVKPKGEITLEYKVTVSGYVIEGAKGWFNTTIGKNKTEASEKITVDASFDGKTLTRDSFGIKVGKVA